MLREVVTLSGHNDRVWHVCWNREGSLLASCGGDRVIRIWGQATGTQEWVCVAILEEGQTRTIRSCEWSPCGKLLAAVSFDATCVIWEYQGKDERGNLQWEVVSSLEGHENEVKSVAWNPSGTLLATSSRDKSVWIWENMGSNDFECVSVLHGHQQDVKAVLFHPREDLVFSASYDDTIKVWAEGDDDWHCIDTLSGHTSTVWGLSVEGNTGERIISCSDDATLIIWKRYGDKWKQVCRLSGYHSSTVYSVDWCKSTGAIASGAADDSIRIFVTNPSTTSSSPDAPSFLQDAVIEHAHQGDVNCVRWNPTTPGMLASCGDDQLVKVWKYQAYEE